MIFAVEVAGDLAAQKPARDRVCGVAAKFRSPAGFVDIDEQPAAVGAVESADTMPDLRHSSDYSACNTLYTGRACRTSHHGISLWQE